MFYSRCGYTFSQPVSAFGEIKTFSKSVPALAISPIPPSNCETKSGQNEDLKQSNNSRRESQKEASPPPPPPPPGAPPPSAQVSSNEVVILDVSLVSACAKALPRPSLAAVAMKLAPKLLAIEQEGFPQINSGQGKERKSENAGGMMSMSKKLL